MEIKKFNIENNLDKYKAKDNPSTSNASIKSLNINTNNNEVDEVTLVDYSSTYEDYLSNLSDYEGFTSCMIDKYIDIPGLDKNFVPQGSCQVGDYTLLVGYSSVSGENSTLYVIDKNGNVIKNITLDGAYHCGAVSYDEKTGSVYITGKSGADDGKSCYINQYGLGDIFHNNGEELIPNNKIQVDNDNSLKSSTNDKSSAAYLTVNDGYLYVGNFDKNGDGIIKRYKIKSDGTLGNEVIIDNPFGKTQGMCVYNYEGEDYYIFSCSGGRTNDSNIYVATMDENGNLVQCGEMTLPCMAEQISNCGDNGISVLFESCAGEYCDSANQTIDDICYLDPEELLVESGAIDNISGDIWMENGNYNSGVASM